MDFYIGVVELEGVRGFDFRGCGYIVVLFFFSSVELDFLVFFAKCFCVYVIVFCGCFVVYGVFGIIFGRVVGFL